MARARIKINGTVGSDLDFTISTLATLLSDGDGSEGAWLWELLDEPEGTATTLSGEDTATCTFTPGKKGSYLIQLTVNPGQQGALVDRVVLSIRHDHVRIPAALERKEAGSRGWAPAMQEALQLLDQMASLLGDNPSADVQAFLAAANKAAMRTVLALGTAATANTGDFDPAGTAAAAAASALSAAETYTDTKVLGLFDVKGVMSCNGDPSFPSALKGDLYVVSVAGKIGGAAGRAVEVGDSFFAVEDNAGGSEASVGTSWNILQYNLNLATSLLAANNLSDLTSTSSARTNLGLGTAAVAATGDFEAAGAIASAISGLSLGTASQSAVGDFDAAGAAATAQSTAESYAAGLVTALKITQGVGRTTNGAPLTLFYFAITDETINRLVITITCKRVGSAKGMCFTRVLDVLRTGAADPSIEVVTTPVPDAATGSATYSIVAWDVYSGQVYVQVQGDASATVDWAYRIEQTQAKVP